MPTHWSESFAIRSFDVDVSGKLRLTALIRHMQNAADGHARSHGLALDQLLTQRKTWVLRELHVEVFRAPRLEEQCRVTTWAASRSGGARAWRDYTVETESGEAIAAGANLWLMLDTSTWRPVRLTAEVLEMVHPTRTCPLELSEIPRISENDFSGASGTPTDVHWLDLDSNGHVNNVRYVDWMLGAVAASIWEKWEPRRFAVAFHDEARFGETLTAFSLARDGSSWNHGIGNSAGKLLCLGRSEWRQRNFNTGG